MATRKSGNRQLNIFLNSYSDLIAVLLICVALGASYFFVIRPRFKSTVETITGNIQEQEMIYKQQSRKLERLKQSLAMYEKMDEKKIARLNQVLPDKYVEERLFGELEEIISRSGYTVSSIDIKRPGQKKASDEDGAMAATEPVDESEEGVGGEAATPVSEVASTSSPVISDNLKTVEIGLSIGSIDYAGLKNLLPVLENSLRLMDVVNLAMSSGEKSAELTLRTYYYQPAQ